MNIVWCDERIVIPRAVVRQMFTYALKQAPEEMCGLLVGGYRGYVDKFFPVANIDNDPEIHYRMSPTQQMHIWQKAYERQLVVGGIVHSHTKRDARMSEIDILYAAYSEVFYVVLSLEPRELRAWSVDRTRDDPTGVWEHQVEIDHSKPGLYYCWSHNKYEDCTRCYSMCGECSHTFKRGIDLVAAHNDVVDELNKETSKCEYVEYPDQVSVCPYCVHSF